MHSDAGTRAPASEAERRGLRRLIEALAFVRISRMGAYRLLSGLPVYAGTRALVREAIGQLGPR